MADELARRAAVYAQMSRDLPVPLLGLPY